MAGSRTLKLSILADVDQLKKNLDTGSKEVEGFGGKIEKFGKVAAAAFAAAAAAAAAYAGKLLVEGVKAAIEDAAAQERLANSLRNVTKATDEQIASVEDQITQMSLAFGIADDNLRPAFQRLATATGDLTSANESLRLALDISAATGKSVEAVSNALAKAYEGNTGALSRLGVGLSTAEIKSMGLQGTMDQLARTFAGAATANANTLQGQITRLQVAFDEAKESVGARLLPVITQLLNYFINVAIPKFIELKDRALGPITRAIEDNREEFRLLVEFAQKYVIPVIVDGFGKAFGFLGKVVGGLLDIIGTVTRGIKSAVDFAIDGINALIRAYNAIPILPNISTISKPSISAPSVAKPSTAMPSAPSISLPSAPSTVNVPPSVAAPSTPSKAPATTPKSPAAVSGVGAGANISDFEGAWAGGSVTVVVQAPSLIDEEGFQRSVVNALNEATNRGTGGGGGLVARASIL